LLLPNTEREDPFTLKKNITKYRTRRFLHTEKNNISKYRMRNFVITKLKMEGSLKAERNITKFTK
jgi:hypothetical protein